MTRVATLEELFPDHVAGFWGQEAGTLEHDVRIIRNGDVQIDGSVRWDQLPIRAVSPKELAKSKVQAGDLLLTTSGNCARVAYVDRDDGAVCASNFTRRLRADPALADPRYLFHLMRGDRFRGLCAPYIRGTTLENLSVKDAFAAVQLPVPAIAEQRRIASILDAADALRAKRRQALARLDDLEKRLVERLTTELPMDDLVPLASVVKGITVGHVGPTSEFFAENGVPFIRTGNVGKKGEIDRTDLRFITPEFHARLQKSRLRAGDLLISRVISDQVRGAIVPPDLDGANCANVIVVRPSEQVPARVLLALLHSPWGQRKLLGRRVGSAQSVVNTSVLQAWRVPVLGADKMQEFELISGRLESVRHSCEAELARIDALFASLQHRAFRGEL